MNKETVQNIFIGLLAAGVLLVGTMVFIQGQALSKIQKSVKCELSGGVYGNNTCACAKDYFLENGSCMGQDGLTQKMLEEIKAGQESLINQADMETWEMYTSESGAMMLFKVLHPSNQQVRVSNPLIDGQLILGRVQQVAFYSRPPEESNADMTVHVYTDQAALEKDFGIINGKVGASAGDFKTEAITISGKRSNVYSSTNYCDGVGCRPSSVTWAVVVGADKSFMIVLNGLPSDPDNQKYLASFQTSVNGE